ncbi:NifB/NifX family molybdenum-iron cluster-binding protein [Daejeonia sp. YH14]|uniref:NifB/NifX family molybdenum-iron cluster-binding protein n=1 Tax=Daejeonia sp. YH14 TaxID=3439042 RepID=UPI003F49819D
MKIIIPTNDRETIAVHTGRCQEFAFYEKENGKIITKAFIKNPHKHNDEGCCAQHSGEHQHNHKELVELFSKAELLIYYAMGKRLRDELEENHISYQKASSVNIEEILQEFQ